MTKTGGRSQEVGVFRYALSPDLGGTVEEEADGQVRVRRQKALTTRLRSVSC